jgi:hypothetical protein
MKRIAILLIFLPVMALGQRIELSLNEGFALATMPAGGGLKPSARGDRSETNLFGSLKCVVHVHKWAFGLGVDAHRISISHPLVNPTGSGITYLHADKKRQQTILANPAIPVVFIVQRTFAEQPKYRFYGGLNVGLVYTCGTGKVKLESVETTSGTELFAAKTIWRNGFGLMAGVTMGYTRYFNNRIGLSFECRPRYYEISARPPEGFGSKTTFHTVAIPLTVGLSVRI